ncbi:MAG: MMPL family transporter [Thermodesulfobacteriota bacterium]|nr:MMPL family transporter [Thermodesulfobacteriota bacterium]
MIASKKKTGSIFKSVSSLLLKNLTLPYQRWEWFFVGLSFCSVAMVFFFVDLTPRVESDFFFSSNDNQLQTSQAISRIFPSSPQVIIQVTAQNIRSERYLSLIRGLTDELVTLAGMVSTKSLINGPVRPEFAFDSPLWSRLLLSKNGSASSIIIMMDKEVPYETFIPNLEKVIEQFSDPSFDIQISGVPYVVELIRRNLMLDLKYFSIAALVVFGLLITIIFRAWRIVVGILVSCVTECALSLMVLHALEIYIGVLTANLATIGFVLTLSHIVFFTSNWRQEWSAEKLNPETAVHRALLRTSLPSLCCMTTTLLGFLSLLFDLPSPFES